MRECGGKVVRAVIQLVSRSCDCADRDGWTEAVKLSAVAMREATAWLYGLNALTQRAVIDLLSSSHRMQNNDRPPPERPRMKLGFATPAEVCFLLEVHHIAGVALHT